MWWYVQALPPPRRSLSSASAPSSTVAQAPAAEASRSGAMGTGGSVLPPVVAGEAVLKGAAPAHVAGGLGAGVYLGTPSHMARGLG